MFRISAVVIALMVGAASAFALTAQMDDQTAVAMLDTEYQLAVKNNDAETMARILDDNFVLVTGKGTVFTKEDLLKSARDKEIVYQQQDEEAGSQTVRVWNNTAVVTAKLWIKYTKDGKVSDRKLWFSDTYVRTGDGWKYVFGQASIALPDAQ